eukprot:TRINITY_DN1808_c1_g1_i1.p1 TRINITY_DN1808_c1_g1~~TRINITY_DN1808_c1_g1_i1.p1  ORF type:complete len:386 (+),score=81.12 TRINITY_DN1808_c1_g1_i1:62-1219(+)
MSVISSPLRLFAPSCSWKFDSGQHDGLAFTVTERQEQKDFCPVRIFTRKANSSRQRNTLAGRKFSTVTKVTNRQDSSLKMADDEKNTPGFDFPNLCPAAQEMMAEALAIVEKELGAELLPSRTISSVRSFQNANGTSKGSIVLRAGADRSKVDRMLVSWLHCELPPPMGGPLDVATLTVLMGTATDAPHLLLEFPFSGGNQRVTAVLDLLPRRDLVLHADYLERTYTATTLPALFTECEANPKLQRYVPPTLFFRAATSPTALLYTLDPTKWAPSPSDNSQEAGIPGALSANNGPIAGGAEGGPKEALDKGVKEILYPIVKKVVEEWAASVRKAQSVPESEREEMAKRDMSVIQNGIEKDLTGSLPRLFGEEVTARIVEAFRKGE